MVQIKNDEQLLSVRSLVNNTLLDFTILQVTTDKKTYNVTLRYKPVKSTGYGVVYKYIDNLYSWLKKNNIKSDIYDYSDNVDLARRDERNPLKVFNLNAYNAI